MAAAEATGGLLALIDRAPLNRRYWIIFALLAAVCVFDFFDLSLIAFILAAIGRSWRLTYGQSALILYGSGAVLGALLWGGLADRFGRRAQTVTGTLTCAISGGRSVCSRTAPISGWRCCASASGLASPRRSPRP